MNRKTTRCATVAIAVMAGFAHIAIAQPSPVSTVQEMKAFLVSAEIVESRPVGRGTTRPWRLTLSDGRMTHDALFQSVDIRRKTQRLGNLTELQFADSYHFNIAAYRLAGLLGLEDMIPVTVERRWKGKRGALSWWIDDVGMDERERVSTGTIPEEPAAWRLELRRMRVFGQLLHDTDRNQGNIIYGSDWKVWMIDFTRAFRIWEDLPNENVLVQCDRQLLERLRALDADQVKAAVDGHLTSGEITGLMQRRDRVVARFDRLAAARGEFQAPTAEGHRPAP